VHGTQGAASASVREVVDSLTQTVVRALMRSRPGGGTFHIEDVQDQVELGLMRAAITRLPVPTCCTRTSHPGTRPAGHPGQAQGHRAACHGRRTARDAGPGATQKSGRERLCRLGDDIQPEPILAETMRNLYDGVPVDEVYKASILAARTLIEKDPTTPTPPPGCCFTRSPAKCWAAMFRTRRWAKPMPITSPVHPEGRR